MTEARETGFCAYIYIDSIVGFNAKGESVTQKLEAPIRKMVASGSELYCEKKLALHVEDGKDGGVIAKDAGDPFIKESSDAYRKYGLRA